MYSTLIIPKRVYEKYNTETCFQIHFTEAGLERLKKKYRKVRGLPAFIHNLMRGRSTNERDLFLNNPSLFAWSPDRTALTIPNLCVNIKGLKENPRALKDDPSEGLALVSWAIDPRLLKKYGWEQDAKQDNVISFREFLHNNDNSKNHPMNYRFFERTESQEEISKLESIDNKSPYLATILDLTKDHLPFLKMFKQTNLKHLKTNFNVDLKKDRIEMYFHFPYPDSTTTLHLHVRVNQGRHPMEKVRTFSLDDVIKCLEKNTSIHTLVLSKKPHYCNNIDILHDIEGIIMQEVTNPFKLASPIINYNTSEPENMTYDFQVNHIQAIRP